MNFTNSDDHLFYQALRIRLIEEAVAKIYPTDKIQSPVHLSIGQENISVALCQGLKSDDLVFGTYRSHAMYLAKGGNLKGFFAELYGKQTGVSKGKAGSMHMSDKSTGVMGSSAIVGSTIPHAVGAALSAKIQKTNQVIVVFFGEGSTGEGVYHESLNFAALKKLPILFVCENNELAIFTREHMVHSYKISQHAKTYGIQSKLIENSWDLNELHQEAITAIGQVRETKKPMLLEIKTYRYLQHVGIDEDYDLGYRSSSEVDSWKEKDILLHDKDRIQKFSPMIEQEIAEAVRFAEESPFPSPNELFKDVL